MDCLCNSYLLAIDLDAGVRHGEGCGGLPHQCSAVSVRLAQHPKMSVCTCKCPVSNLRLLQSLLSFPRLLAEILAVFHKLLGKDLIYFRERQSHRPAAVCTRAERAYLYSLLLLEQTRSQQEHSRSTLRVHT